MNIEEIFITLAYILGNITGIFIWEYFLRKQFKKKV